MDHILVYDEFLGKGVDIDFERREDGHIDIIYIDYLQEGDLNV